LQEFAGIRVTAKDVERVAEGTGKEMETWQIQERSALLKEEQEVSEKIPMLYVSYDGTGVPMVPRETAGRKGEQADGSCRTREVKLGCVFTQTTVDPQGRPVNMIRGRIRAECGSNMVAKWRKPVIS